MFIYPLHLFHLCQSDWLKKKDVLEEVTFPFSPDGEDEPFLMGLKVMWISEKKLLDSQEKQV